MATIDDFLRLDLRTGVIVDVADFPRAPNPSYRITVDFGPEIGIKQSALQATNYEKADLRGMQVIRVVNFPPRNVAGFQSEVLVLGVPQADGRVSLLTPSREAVVGGKVY
jgi:tRNA-binding protein